MKDGKDDNEEAILEEASDTKSRRLLGLVALYGRRFVDRGEMGLGLTRQQLQLGKQSILTNLDKASPFLVGQEVVV